jgi:imidazolonepropionase-like amidohydrolase
MVRLFAYICLALFCVIGSIQRLAAQSLVIANARIIDGNGGAIARGSVVVRDGRIVSVSEGAPAHAPGAQTIDAKGMTVMPGFIDAHRHVMQGDGTEWLKEQAVQRMQEFLDGGFTTVFSCGDPLEPILELRRRLKASEIKGPRLWAVGRVPLARAAGGFRVGVDPARVDLSRPPDRPTKAATAIPHEETLATVRSLAKAGVDAFKMAIIVTPGGPEKDTLSVITAEARHLGIPTITHAVTVEDALAAVEAHTSVLAHTPHIGQLTEEQARTIAASGIPMMSTVGIFLPTFAEDNARVRARTGDDNLPRFRDLDPFPMNTLSSAGQGPVNARMLWDAGITYGYGTDTSFLPRDSLAQELRALQLVFSRKDIIKIMTINAAKVIGRGNELGTLEPGKLADMVILDGDPLADIQAVLKVKVAIKGGEIAVDRR